MTEIVNSGKGSQRQNNEASSTLKVVGSLAGMAGVFTLATALFLRPSDQQGKVGGASSAEPQGSPKPSPGLVSNTSKDRIATLRSEIEGLALMLRRDHDRSFSRQELVELREHARKLANEMHEEAKTDFSKQWERLEGETRLDACLRNSTSPDSKKAFLLNKVDLALTVFINGGLPDRAGQPQSSTEKKMEERARSIMLEAAQGILATPDPLVKN